MQRFELAKLSSFQELAEPGWQKELADLHDDYFYHRHVRGVFSQARLHSP